MEIPHTHTPLTRVATKSCQDLWLKPKEMLPEAHAVIVWREEDPQLHRESEANLGYT